MVHVHLLGLDTNIWEFFRYLETCRKILNVLLNTLEVFGVFVRPPGFYFSSFLAFRAVVTQLNANSNLFEQFPNANCILWGLWQPVQNEMAEPEEEDCGYTEAPNYVVTFDWLVANAVKLNYDRSN